MNTKWKRISQRAYNSLQLRDCCVWNNGEDLARQFFSCTDCGGSVVDCWSPTRVSELIVDTSTIIIVWAWRVVCGLKHSKVCVCQPNVLQTIQALCRFNNCAVQEYCKLGDDPARFASYPVASLIRKQLIDVFASRIHHLWPSASERCFPCYFSLT